MGHPSRPSAKFDAEHPQRLLTEVDLRVPTSTSRSSRGEEICLWSLWPGDGLLQLSLVAKAAEG